jgi:hypothetical protein
MHLAVVFDLEESTAIRYAAAARQLPQRPHEGDLVAWPRTRGSLDDNASNAYSGPR